MITAVRDCREETADYLASLRKYGPEIAYNLVIVDDGSGEPTRDYLRSSSRRHGFKLLRNDESRGFAFANNRGVAAAKSEWLLFMNNDLVLTKDWFAPFKQVIEGKAGLDEPGCIGNVQLDPRTKKIDHAGVSFASGIPRHFLQGENEFPKRKYSEFLAVTGACFMIRRDLFLKVGGFDETYRTGFEDIDLCLRLRMLGFRHYVANQSRIYHKRGSSSERDEHQTHNSKVFYGRWGKLITRFEEWDLLNKKKTLGFGISKFRVFIGSKLLHGSSATYLFRDFTILHSLFFYYLSKSNLSLIDQLSSMAVSWFPENPDAWNLRSLSSQRNGITEEAIGNCRKALSLDSNSFRLQFRLASLLLLIGDAHSCLSELKKLKGDDSLKSTALSLRGEAFSFLGKREFAVLEFRRSLLFHPISGEVHLHLSEELCEIGEMQKGLSHLRLWEFSNDRSTSLTRKAAELFAKLGYALKALNLIESIQKAKKDFLASDYSRLGKYAYLTGDLLKAKIYLERSLEVGADVWETLHYLGNTFVGLKSFGAAVDAYESALEISPSHPSTVSNIANARAYMCDWSLRSSEIKDLQAFYRSGVLEVGAFDVLGLDMEAVEVAKIAHLKATKIIERSRSLRQNLRFRFKEHQVGQVRLGFVSSDFRNHAVGHLFLGLIVHLNQEKYKICLYSSGPDDGSEVRRKLIEYASHFKDISALSLSGKARCIHSDNLDLLVDLGGHSMGSNPELLALRPARRQAHYLGYAETLGPGLVDWHIADDYVLPASLSRYFHEEVLTMRGCFLPPGEPLDLKRRLSRKAVGLPSKGFVFCAFHAAYKLEPEIWSCWMRILKAVPESWLWVKCESLEAEKCLRSECLRHGVSPVRILWAKKLPTRGEHVARMSASDLFLDTPAYNGHATAIDALHAGLPILTVSGNRFCSRVCGSILNSMGLEELICSDTLEYESRAIKIATDSSFAKGLRKRVRTNRMKVLCPEQHVERFEEVLSVILSQDQNSHRSLGKVNESQESIKINTKVLSIILILEAEPSVVLAKLDEIFTSFPSGQIEIVAIVNQDLPQAIVQRHQCLSIVKRKTGESFSLSINFGIDASSGSHVCLLRDNIAFADGFSNRLFSKLKTTIEEPKTGMVVLRSSRANERLIFCRSRISKNPFLCESPYVVIRREVFDLIGGLDHLAFPNELAFADISLRMSKVDYETKTLIVPEFELSSDEEALPLPEEGKKNFIKRWGREPIMNSELRSIGTWKSENAILASIPHRDQISPKRSIVRNGHLVIHWVIPDFMPGSGGHSTIFRMVRFLEEFGHENKIWITFASRHGDGDQVRNLIREHFAEIEAEVGILRPESLDQIRGDAIFATEWRTAYFVRGIKGVSSKMYFVQDYEPYFFPVGTRYLLADATYDFNLHCVCMGSWLKEKMKRRKIASVEAIDFGCDTNCYRFSDSTPRKENVIACYCRTATERRVSELCLHAFSILHEKGQDFHVDLFGDSDLRQNFSFSHANLGVLPPEALGILYQECTLGVVFSATNVSLIPLEMMACGLPVLELDVEGTRHAFPKGVVSLAKPDPEAIADALERLLDDKEARRAQSEQALAYARKTSWEKSARKLESAVRKTLSGKGANR